MLCTITINLFKGLKIIVSVGNLFDKAKAKIGTAGKVV
jgi:hypothetical protein